MNTREVTAATAEAVVGSAAPFLDHAKIAFLKIDSLLRGHAALETATILKRGDFSTAVVAPAFPAQNRITMGGRQRFADGSLIPQEIERPLVVQLRSYGFEPQVIRNPLELSDTVPSVAIFDASCDDDLDRIARTASSLTGRVLWVGTRGLAAALARKRVASERPLAIGGPTLFILGTQHPATREQLRNLEQHRGCTAIVHGPPQQADSLAVELGAVLEHNGVAALAFRHSSASPTTVKRYIWVTLAEVLKRIQPPGTLVVSGGDTLAAACAALGATLLEVGGEYQPGLPFASFGDGRWVGVQVVSKAGAFGQADALARLAADLEGRADE